MPNPIPNRQHSGDDPFLSPNRFSNLVFEIIQKAFPGALFYRAHGDEPWDAVFPEGIAGISTKQVLLHLVFANDSTAAIGRVTAILDTSTHMGRHPMETQSLFVTSVSLSKDARARIPKKISNITLWDRNDIFHLASSNQTVVSEATVTPERIGAERIISEDASKARDRNLERTELISRLRDAYRSDSLALFLGAGISIDSGIPSWEGLLHSLLLKFVTASAQDLNVTQQDAVHLAQALSKYRGRTPSLILGQYIKLALGGEFTEGLQSVLYESVKSPPAGGLISAIVELCRFPRRHNGLSAIITYNYDDLLQTALSHAGIPHATIATPEDHPIASRLPIYHVHGHIPRSAGGARSVVVLAEEQYHEMFNDPYSWPNLIQLNHMMYKTCLFVGQSMSDPNLRRLLELTAKLSQRPTHYSILPRTSAKDLKHADTPNNVDMMLERLARLDDHIMMASLDKLGVAPLWIDDFSEIPEIILQIKAE